MNSIYLSELELSSIVVFSSATKSIQVYRRNRSPCIPVVFIANCITRSVIERYSKTFRNNMKYFEFVCSNKTTHFICVFSFHSRTSFRWKYSNKKLILLAQIGRVFLMGKKNEKSS